MQPTSELGGSALMVRTFGSMGTVVSLTVPAGAFPGTARGERDRLDAAAAAVERVFARSDETFSLYRPGSEASRLARGELSLRESSAGMRDRYADALSWRLMTEGAFSPERPDGVLDLSGIIKGYAIGQAGEALQALGITDWCLNAGGDVLVMGSPVPGSGAAWAAGVVDPKDRSALLSGLRAGRAPARGAPWRRRARRSGATTSGPRAARGAEFVAGLGGRGGHRHGRRARDGDRCGRSRHAAPRHGRLGRSMCSPSDAAGNCSRRRDSAPRLPF